MNTVKDLLLSNLTEKGFTYYPSMKRLMLKSEGQESKVIVLEMNEDDKCRVYFDNNTNTVDQKLSYNLEAILSYVKGLLNDNTTNFRFAA